MTFYEGLVIASGLADEFFCDEAGVAFALGACRGLLAFSSGQLGASGRRSQFQIGWVEAGQRLTGLDRGAGIDQAGGDLPANAESQIDLMPGADFTGVDTLCVRCARSGLNQHDPCGRWWRLTLAATRKNGGKSQ